MKLKLGLGTLLILGAVAFFLLQKRESLPQSPFNTAKPRWEFNNSTNTWQAGGTPPDCPKPLVFPSPVDTKLASSVLYPGQVRGGDYKAHGGFRFDGLKSNEVKMYAPFDGNLIQAAQHTQGSEVQYSLYFINDCGVMYKFDHLLELTDKFNKIMKSVPLKGEGDTRTTSINPSVFTSKGELIATKVGLSGNIFVDFGVYDLRHKNGVDYSTRDYFNISQYGEYGICWLNNLNEPERTIVKGLPGADGQSGKKSDYCR